MKSGRTNQASRIWFQHLFTLLWFSWVVALLLLSSSSLYDTIQANVSDPVYFKIRHYLKKTPELSPRLKVFALDDGTIGYLKRSELKLEDLHLLLANIARQKPKAIILDKLFASAPEDGEIGQIMETMRSIDGAPMYSGAWINPKELNYRKPNFLDEDRYGIKHWIEGDRKRGENFIRRHLHSEKGFIYAYDEVFEGVFTAIGHLRFDRVGSIFPVIGYDKYILPHIALYAADSLLIRDDTLLVNDHVLPLTEKGTVIVNHRPEAQFYENMKSLRFAIKRARANQPEASVKEGDVVVILFNFFTGSTDFLEGAPFGNLPGGLLVSTLVDSVLENRWLKPIGQLPWLILIFTVVGTIIARISGPIQYWGNLFLVGFSFFALSNYLFSYQAFVLPWFLPLMGLIGGGTLQYVHLRLGTEWKAISLENRFLVERALRLEEEKTKVQLSERLNLGRAVQEILLPPQGHQNFGNFRFSVSYIPAQEMSGDWIYIWGKQGGHRRIILGDVVGKGPSAAIPVAILIGILGECERTNMEMEETLHYLNKRVIELFHKQITTSCTAIVLRDTRKVELYNAGSPGWFLKTEGRSRHVPLRSSPLGMSLEATFTKEEITMKDNDFLFTFTDGYMEGARAFRRLITRMNQLMDTPTFVDLQLMLDDVGKAFRLEDDRSLLMLNTWDEDDIEDSQVA